MSSVDTPPFSEDLPAEDNTATRGAAPVPRAEDLATFSVLADPNQIAGQQPREANGEDQKVVVDRLRAELQRRAQQVERMRRDLSASKTGHDASVDDTAKGWKSLGTPPAVASADKPGPGDEAGLKRLLHAAHRARHELQDRLNARDGEFEETIREKKELLASLEEARAELASLASERERVSELAANLTTRSSAYERLSDECNALRRGLVESQREAAEARKASERNREVLSETRSRVAEREAEASALRAALATNQKQAQARECDNEELKAALSIASETLEARRAELRQARAELDATTRRLQESELESHRLANELQAQQERTSQQTNDLARFKEAVPRLEAELQERQAEAETLRQRLTSQQSELVDAREALSQARRQCDGLSDELETEREAHRRARERATEREATVSQLHETLASIGKAASIFPLTQWEGDAREAQGDTDSSAHAPVETRPAAALDAAEDAIAHPSDEPEEAPNATVAETNEAVSAGVVSAAPLEASTQAAAIAEDTLKPDDAETLLSHVAASTTHAPPAIFRRWRDQQVAAKFASLDISSVEAFFARHIASAAGLASGETLEILSLGADDPDFEFRIARALRKQGQAGFRIHFPQRDSEHAARCLRKAAGAGIDQELAPYDPSAWTRAGLPEHFQVVVGDGALSRSTQVEPLIDALERASREGTQLALAERIGHGHNRTAHEMGERIWRLMPERYKQNHLTGQVDTEYATDSAAGEDADLLALLRSRFAFEDFASFGHLVDRFIGPAIGPNFDPDNERDLRFIQQIANLDEAKLDSGALRPLHMISRLSPRDSRDE